MKFSVLCGLVVFTILLVCASIALGAEVADPARFALYPIVKAPVGASQDYLIISTMRSLVVGGNRFSPELGEVEEESFSIAVHARYTVLEPDAGVGRLGVEAMALDFPTLLLLAMPVWKGVLRLPPSDVVWEDGNSPDWVYELGVTLDWLREWMTSPQDAPQGPIAAGERWQAVAHISDNPQFGGFETLRGAFEVAGEYKELLRQGDDAPPAARIHEAFTGLFEDPEERIPPAPWCLEEPDESLALDDYLRWIEECLEHVVAMSFPTAMDVEGFLEVLLVQDDFPWSGSSGSTATMIFARDDAPEMTLEFVSDMVRYDGPFEQGGIVPLRSGEVFTAQLGGDSWSGVIFGAPSDSPADLYSFRGEEGDGVRIEMASEAFAPYLVLMDSDWNVITESHSFLDEPTEVLASIPHTGMYYIQATTTDGWVTGEYEISLEVGPDVVVPDGEWWDADEDWEWDANFGWDFDWDDSSTPSWEEDLVLVEDVRPYHMGDCAVVSPGHEVVWVIDSHEAFRNAIRSDAAGRQCLERLETPGFDRYVLLGVGYDSGWCGEPPDLAYEVWLDETYREVYIYIDYPANGTPCEGAPINQLWLLVPRPPDDVEWGFYAFAEPYLD